LTNIKTNIRELLTVEMGNYLWSTSQMVQPASSNSLAMGSIT